MTGDLQFALVATTGILFVVDPFAVVPLFLGLAGRHPPAVKRALAARAAFAAFCILVLFALAGGAIFRALGISMGAFRVAGGLMLLIMALDMVRARRSSTRATAGEEAESSHHEDIALVPLAMPMLAGPGAIATVMVFVSRAEGNPLRVAAVLGAVAIACLVSWLLLRMASVAGQFLRRTTMHVVERLMGLLLGALAIEFVATGIKDLLPALR